MFKYLLVTSLLVMTVMTQDMPPPDLDISTRVPLTTTEPTTTPEPITTTAEAETTTIIEEPTTTTEAATTETDFTTSEPTTSTIRSDIPISPVTDSPFLPTTTATLAPTDPFHPSQTDYSGVRCYFKSQYGYPQWRWTCRGYRYFYPIECFKCCLFQYTNFAGCFKAEAQQCNGMNHHHHGYYK